MALYINELPLDLQEYIYFIRDNKKASKINRFFVNKFSKNIGLLKMGESMYLVTLDFLGNFINQINILCPNNLQKIEYISNKITPTNNTKRWLKLIEAIEFNIFIWERSGYMGSPKIDRARHAIDRINYTINNHNFSIYHV